MFFSLYFLYNIAVEWLKNARISLTDVLLSIYIIAFPFHRSVWKLPFFQEKIQPAELFLGLLVLYGLFLIFSSRVKFWFSPFDIPVLLWLSANLISNAFTGFDRHLVLETTKVLAVVLVYFVFRLLLTDRFLSKLTDIVLFSTLIASLLAILGSTLSAFGIQTEWVAQMQAYPYIGKIGRAMAFTSTPNMLGSILMTALLLKAAQLFKRKAVKKWEIFVLAVCLLAFFAAVSKTILCFLLGLFSIALLVAGKRSFSFKFFVALAMVFLALVYLVGSHFMFVSALTPQLLDSMQQGHVTRVYHKLGPLLVVETSYMTIKRSCLYMLKQSFPWGIGTRNFKAQVPRLKEKGIYNQETKPFDPHCTPLGTLTELGILGGIILVILYLQIGRGLLAIYRNKSYMFHYINTGIIAIFLALSLEGWVTDIMNFRHYWLLLGVLAYMTRQAAKRGVAPNL